jgi:hypothetical protein
MPSKTKAQARLMAAAAHNPAFAKKVGIPVNVAKEFNAADKGKKFATGGRAKQQAINSPKTDHGSMNLFKGGGMAKSDMKEDMKADIKQDKAIIKKAFKMHDSQEHKGQHTDLSKLKKGGMAMKKMATGGMSRMASKGEHSVQTKSKRGAEEIGMCGGGKAMKKMAKGGTASARADGIASKGKTKGKFC